MRGESERSGYTRSQGDVAGEGAGFLEGRGEGGGGRRALRKVTPIVENLESA